MIKIKKGALIFLMILSLVCGAACMFSAHALGLFSKVGVKGSHMLSEKQYETYVHLSETYGKIDELRTFILKNYYTDVNEDDLETGMLRGLFEGLDDIYSYYMTPQEYDQLMISLTGVYSGVGITIMAGDSGYVEVLRPTKGSPAEEAGLRKGDQIMAVDGVEYSGADLDVCAMSIRGPEGTNVVLTIRRGVEIFDVEITRRTIINPTVEYEMLEDGIGYILVSSFEEYTADDFKKALAALQADGARAFVLDLRDNGGGLVDSAVSIADILLEKGVVAYTEDHNGKKSYYRSAAGRTQLPYVVLVNDGSASASEILSAGVKDNGGGPLVGTLTYGKGIIQSIEKLADGSGVKLTILQYFSPSGSVIHKTGIEPDYVVELTDECYDEEGNLIDDLQLKKAIELLR